MSPGSSESRATGGAAANGTGSGASIVALFGGTFDPPHVGHLIAAEQVVDQLGLARLVFMPAGVPPHKAAAPVTDGHHRLRMIELAVGEQPRFAVSDMELREPGASYTIRTVRRLKEEGAEEVLLVVGADSLIELQTWMEPERLLAESRIVVVGRPGVDLGAAPDAYRRRVTVVDSPLIGLSSTDIRARVRAGRSIRYLVPAAVGEYIEAQRLYVG